MKKPARKLFTDADLDEIYYALETKVWMINKGEYGPEIRKGEDKKWKQHLHAIQRKLCRI